jgi:hypothetical protein
MWKERREPNFLHLSESVHDCLFDQSGTHANIFILNFVSSGILHTDVSIRGQKLNSNFPFLDLRNCFYYSGRLLWD